LEIVEFNLQTVTPVFSYGSNQNKVELRPSSLKGFLRYWYRAALATNDLKKLHESENNIFGSTEEASNFSIRIKDLNKINNESKNINSELFLPHKSKYRQSAIKKDLKFDVVLTIKNSDYTKKIEDSFLLAILLGGIGQRSRRGFGSLKNVDRKFDSKDEFLRQVKDLLGSLSSKQYKIEKGKLVMVDSNDFGYPVIKEVIIGKSNNMEKMLKKIGKATHNNNHNAIGNGNPRMASPVYVTINKINNKYYPIITKLEAVYPEKNYNVSNSKEQINKFIKELR
jgi:CRISPR-associated protein Cmr1